MIPIRYNLRSLLVRRATSLTTAVVVALVVMILFILSGFVAGLRATVIRTAVRDNWIVISRGTTSEGGSYITRDQYEILKSRSQIATTSDGQALVSPEVATGFNPAANQPNGAGGFGTLLRGVYPIAYEVHSKMRLVAGRWVQHGSAEMVVGRKLAARFPFLTIGSSFKFGRHTFKVVGIFSDDDSARESEVLTDLDVLTQDIHMGSGFAVLHLVLLPGQEDDFVKSLSTDARVKVDAMPEGEFYAKQTGFVEQLRMMGLAVALVLAIGSIFGAMNTMYSAVARRTGEIGVLRVLGFSRLNVLSSFVVESVLLGIAGAVLGEAFGIVAAYATGLHSQLMNVGEFIFRFQLTSGAFVSGIIAGTLIGALGGLLPAGRASRIGVVDSLRTV